MRKLVLTTLAAACLTLPLSAQLSAAQDTPAPLDFGPMEKLTIVTEKGPQVFDIEVADTLAEQARGMMYRDDVPVDTGMLFEFAEPKIATIWMKNTGIPLDILFVRSNGTILKIEHSHKPYTLRTASSEAPVAAVVELAGGRSLELGIQPGDLVKHEFFGTENAGNAN
ncbi:MAG: DUF192 domain-containing protein [Maricaulaceae bacterium]